MNVKELKEFLAPLADDLPVVMSADSEGNSYDTVHGVAEDVYFDEGGYIQLYHPDDLYDGPCGCPDSDCDDCYDKHDRKDGVVCVVIWP